MGAVYNLKKKTYKLNTNVVINYNRCRHLFVQLLKYGTSENVYCLYTRRWHTYKMQCNLLITSTVWNSLGIEFTVL